MIVSALDFSWCPSETSDGLQDRPTSDMRMSDVFVCSFVCLFVCYNNNCLPMGLGVVKTVINFSFESLFLLKQRQIHHTMGPLFGMLVGRLVVWCVGKW